MNAKNPPQPDITRTITETVEIMVCNILTHADTIYEGMTFEEIRNSDLDSASQKMAKNVDEAVQKLVTLVNEARVNELKRLLSIRHRVVNSIDLECVEERIKELEGRND